MVFTFAVLHLTHAVRTCIVTSLLTANMRLSIDVQQCDGERVPELIIV
jgi:hypothetical protein